MLCNSRRRLETFPALCGSEIDVSHSTAAGANVAIADALRALAAVNSLTRSLISRLAENPRNLSKAHDVCRVFRVYESRLRAIAHKESVLTNSQGDLVLAITRTAERALTVLNNFDGDASLGRAYANGATIESNLILLESNLGNDSVFPDISSLEIYRPGSNIPPIPDNVHLELGTRDDDGKFCAPEGELKCAVLSSSTSSRVVVARGRARPATEMAGVGKSTALIALGHDEDAKALFCDGVLYIALGADASVKEIIRSLSKIMQFTGARAKAEADHSQNNLTAAVDAVAQWFRGGCNLFLIDDIGPTESCREGYLPQLRHILDGSPTSRIALTTRDRRISTVTGSHVDFGARVPRGEASTSIFLAHATTGWQTDVGELDKDLPPVQGILDLCPGLPLALAICGRAIALHVSYGYDFKTACSMYYKDMEEQSTLRSSILERAIELSWKYIGLELEGNASRIGKRSIADLYVSLCVLTYSGRVESVDFLARIWALDESIALQIVHLFSSMKLANISGGCHDGNIWHELRLHDLQLEYCHQKAERENKLVEWQERLRCVHDHQMFDAWIDNIQGRLE